MRINPLLGSLFCHYQSTASPYTKEPSTTPWHYDMRNFMRNYGFVFPRRAPRVLHFIFDVYTENPRAMRMRVSVAKDRTCRANESANPQCISELINPRRACAARVTLYRRSVCVSVCLSVCLFSATVRNKAANKRYQRVQRYTGLIKKMAIFVKILR